MRSIMFVCLTAAVVAQPCTDGLVQPTTVAIPEDIRGIWRGPFRQGNFAGTTQYTIRNTTWSNAATITTPITIPVEAFEQYVCNLTVRTVAGIPGPVVLIWHTSSSASNPLAGRKRVQCVQFARMDNITLRSWQNDTSQFCTGDLLPAVATTEVNVVTYTLQAPRPPASGAGKLSLGIAHWAAVVVTMFAAWAAQ